MLRHFLLCCLLTLALATPALAADGAADLAAEVNAMAPGWTAGHTSVSDLDWDQKLIRCGTLKPAVDPLHAGPDQALIPPADALPSAWDWRDVEGRNVVTPVRNQEACGSCWAFSTLAAFESRLVMDWDLDPETLDLSEQALVSCSLAGDCTMGGYMSQAAKQIALGGVPTEECFPYGGWNLPCIAGCPDQSAWTSSYGTSVPHFPAMTVESLKAHLVAFGPVAVGFVVYDDFYSYTGGVYRHVAGEASGGHGVCLVGYDDAEQCFIVKNSWGTGWGEDGYFRIAYDQVENEVEFGYDAACFASSNQPEACLVPMLGINDSLQEGSSSADEKVTVMVGLGTPHPPEGLLEWWLVMYQVQEDEDENITYVPLRSYVLGRGWVDGMQPMQVAEGKPLPAVTVLRRTLPVGDYAFAFGLDTAPDGNFHPAWQARQSLSVYPAADQSE